MPPIRVLIVEDNALQRDLCAAMLQNQPGIQVIYTASNGKDALHSIQQLKPDVVLFDMVMPHMDGFALLESVHALPQAAQPAMIALTSLGRDDFITRAVALGVDDYLIKPTEPEQLAQRIRTIHQSRTGQQQPSIPPQAAHAAEREPMSPDNIRKYAALLLMQLDVPAHLHGYQYLLEAIVLAVQTPTIVKRMTSELYPAVGERCSATPSSVERSIRNAVAITWDRNGGAALNRILGRSTAVPADKPANGELIAELAARIRMKELR